MYMNMLEEDDGSFPRVSELSLRLEQENKLKESRARIKEAEEEYKRNRDEKERL